jgi:diguanylate cyclase (GGDEF)-like protein
LAAERPKARKFGRLAVRSGPGPTLSRRLKLYLALVESAALAVIVICVTLGRFNSTDLVRSAALVGLCICFQLAAARVDRLRFRLGGQVFTDMSSVWMFAAAVVLPPVLTVACVLVTASLVMYLRRRIVRRSYRQVLVLSSAVLSSAAASGVISLFGRQDGELPASLRGLLAVTTAGIVYIVLAAGIVMTARSLLERPASLRQFIGTLGDHSLELATLSLGALLGVSILENVALLPLALIPMLILHRGALIRQIEQAATTDPKTGLLNAVAWQQFAEQELARAEREHETLALVIADMDHFKRVNDSYGHLVGDIVLKAVADALTSELRAYDAVGRFGGEEFVAVIADSDRASAQRAAERILARIRGLTIPTHDGKANVAGLSMSLGVAMYPSQGTDVDELLQAADGALYRAKRWGRDRVVFADDDGREAGLLIAE